MESILQKMSLKKLEIRCHKRLFTEIPTFKFNGVHLPKINKTIRPVWPSLPSISEIRVLIERSKEKIITSERKTT